MNSNETLVEQIRRLNQEEQHQHEIKRQAALEKIRLMRRSQREQQERQRDYQ